MHPVLVTPPSVAPVALAELKAQVEVDFADRDALIQQHLDAAVAHLDGWSGVLGRCLIAQTWRVSYAGWSPWLPLPFPNVSAAVVRYRDSEGQDQVLASGWHIMLQAQRDALWIDPATTLPELATDVPEPVTVEVTAGFGPDPADVPAAIRTAILMLGAHWIRNREAGGRAETLPFGVDLLIAPYWAVA